MGEIFGKKLRAHREARGISGNGLSKLSGILQGTLSAIESGERPASTANLEALAGVEQLGLSMDVLRAWHAADRAGKEGLWLLMNYAEDVLLEVAKELGPPGVDRAIVQVVTPETIAARGVAYVQANQASITGGARELSPKEVEVVAQLRTLCAGNLHDMALEAGSYVWELPKGDRLRELKHVLVEQLAARGGQMTGDG